MFYLQFPSGVPIKSTDVLLPVRSFPVFHFEKMEGIVKGALPLDSTTMQGVGDPVSPPEMIVLAKYARMFFRAPSCDRPKILSETVQILQGTWPRWNCRTVRLWFNNHEEEIKPGEFETHRSDDESGFANVRSVPNSEQAFQEPDKVHVEEELKSDEPAGHQEIFVSEGAENEELNCATLGESSSGQNHEDQQQKATVHQSPEEITKPQDSEPVSTSKGAKVDVTEEPKGMVESNDVDPPQTRRPLRRARLRQMCCYPCPGGYTGNMSLRQPGTTPAAQQVFSTVAPVVPVQAPVLTGGTMIVLQPIPCQSIVQFGCGGMNVYMTTFVPQLCPQNNSTPVASRQCRKSRRGLR